MHKKPLNLLFFILLLSLGLFLTLYFHQQSQLNPDKFYSYQIQLTNYASHHHTLFVLMYILCYVLLIVCAVPATILLNIAAGFLFGSMLGVAVVVFSYTLGSVGNFILVRYLLKDLFVAKFAKFSTIIYGRGKYGTFLNLVSLRFIQVIPFWLVNIVAAICNIRLYTFSLATFFGIIPTAIIYVVIGTHVHNISTGTNLLAHAKELIPLGLLAILLILPNFLKKSTKFS